MNETTSAFKVALSFTLVLDMFNLFNFPLLPRVSLNPLLSIGKFIIFSCLDWSTLCRQSKAILNTLTWLKHRTCFTQLKSSMPELFRASKVWKQSRTNHIFNYSLKILSSLKFSRFKWFTVESCRTMTTFSFLREYVTVQGTRLRLFFASDANECQEKTKVEENLFAK